MKTQIQFKLFLLLTFASISVFANHHVDVIKKTEKSKTITKTFKVNSSAEIAVEQIKEKKYAVPFLGTTRKVYAIGMSFNTALKEMDSWLIEELQ